MAQLAVASIYGLAFADTGSTPTKSAAGFTTPGRILVSVPGSFERGWRNRNETLALLERFRPRADGRLSLRPSHCDDHLCDHRSFAHRRWGASRVGLGGIVRSWLQQGAAARATRLAAASGGRSAGSCTDLSRHAAPDEDVAVFAYRDLDAWNTAPRGILDGRARTAGGGSPRAPDSLGRTPCGHSRDCGGCLVGAHRRVDRWLSHTESAARSRHDGQRRRRPARQVLPQFGSNQGWAVHSR